MIMRPPLRKLMLTLHIATSVGLLGAVKGFLALALVGFLGADPETSRGMYIAMEPLTQFIIVPLAGLALALGLVESLGTRWGLLQHYWIVAKLVLTLLAIAVLLMQLDTVALLADAADFELLWTARISMVLHATGGAVVLLLAVVLSVYKPRGRLPRRKAAAV